MFREIRHLERILSRRKVTESDSADKKCQSLRPGFVELNDWTKLDLQADKFGHAGIYLSAMGHSLDLGAPRFVGCIGDRISGLRL